MVHVWQLPLFLMSLMRQGLWWRAGVGVSACSKTHAASRVAAAGWLARVLCRGCTGLCHRRWQYRDSLAQGLTLPCRADPARGRRWAAVLWLLACSPAAAAAVPVPVAAAAAPASASAGTDPLRCPGGGAGPGPALAPGFEPLAPGLWLLRAAPGEPDEHNRGRVANLLLARQGAAVWALGSGPSPALGRALACQVPAALGAPLRAVVSPWARPELVLGVAGLGAAVARQHWAHAEVAAAMAAQCPLCADRLRQRLGAAAADLGPQPIRLPRRLLHGEQGRLGPWQWWRLPRAAGRWVTVWRWQAAPGAPAWWFAPGLIAGGGVPDGHDAELATLLSSTRRLQALAQADGGAARWVGDQGGALDAGAPAREAAYWQALLAAAEAAQERGAAETDAAPDLAGQPAGWTAQAGHALNWQRAWRQVEPLTLGGPAR